MFALLVLLVLAELQVVTVCVTSRVGKCVSGGWGTVNVNYYEGMESTWGMTIDCFCCFGNLVK